MSVGEESWDYSTNYLRKMKRHSIGTSTSIGTDTSIGTNIRTGIALP